MARGSAPSFRSRLLGWWYLSIGAGFVLLAVHRMMIGEARRLIAIRLLIAAGFFLLGYLELKGKLRH